MEREMHSQLELFSQGKDYSEKVAKRSESFFSYMRNYEKQIILLICFLATALVSFALGIEKGKSLATLKSTDNRFDTAKKIEDLAIEKLVKIQSSVITKEISGTIDSTKPILSGQLKASIPIGSYTIQVASYRTKDSAEKEEQSLRKKGFSPLVLYKGNFSVVCVGNFTNKKEAQSFLSKLKGQYRDCYIRRL